MEEKRRQSDDVTMLCEADQKLQESQAATSESIPTSQCDANESVIAPTAESREDTQLDTDAEVGEENELQKGQIIETQAEQKTEDSQVAAAIVHCSDCEGDSYTKKEYVVESY